MRRTISTTLFAVCACVAVAAAQTTSPTTSTTQSPATTSSTPSQPPAAAASQTAQRAAGIDNITLEGCVQRNVAAASSTTGATGTAGSAAGSFILEKAAKSATATATTDGSSAVAVVSTYRLDGDDAKLSPHVGHKVEITGTVETAMGTATASAGAASPSLSVANAPKLKVEAVKMIAASCTP